MTSLFPKMLMIQQSNVTEIIGLDSLVTIILHLYHLGILIIKVTVTKIVCLGWILWAIRYSVAIGYKVNEQWTNLEIRYNT